MRGGEVGGKQVIARETAVSETNIKRFYYLVMSKKKLNFKLV